MFKFYKNIYQLRGWKLLDKKKMNLKTIKKIILC